jgi:hypothetical protein
MMTRILISAVLILPTITSCKKSGPVEKAGYCFSVNAKEIPPGDPGLEHFFGEDTVKSLIALKEDSVFVCGFSSRNKCMDLWRGARRRECTADGKESVDFFVSPNGIFPSSGPENTCRAADNLSLDACVESIPFLICSDN